MVNWSDPVVIGKQAQAFAQVLLVMLGVYSWEVLNTLEFDYKIFAKWKDFKVSCHRPRRTLNIASRVLIVLPPFVI